MEEIFNFKLIDELAGGTRLPTPLPSKAPISNHSRWKQAKEEASGMGTRAQTIVKCSRLTPKAKQGSMLLLRVDSRPHYEKSHRSPSKCHPVPASHVPGGLTSFTLQQGPPSVWPQPPPLPRLRKRRKQQRAGQWRRRKTTQRTKENNIYTPTRLIYTPLAEGSKGKKGEQFYVLSQKRGKKRKK